MVALALVLACATGGLAESGGDSGGLQDDSGDSGDSAHDSDDSDTSVGDTADTAPPADADADGFVALADGGDDCDDFDPTRFPGAREYCDGKDHDCDGEPNEGTRCSDLLVPDEMLAGRIEGSALALVDDVTGDGLADIGIWGSVDNSGAGSAYAVIFAQGTLPGVGPRTDVYRLPGVRARWTEPYGDSGTYTDASGDIDGDGINDLAIVSEVGYSDGGIPILFGPFAVGDVYDLGDATEAWRPTDVDPELLRWGGWGSARVKGDFNQDGLTDNVEVGAEWTVTAPMTSYCGRRRTRCF